MKDTACVDFLQWALPQLNLRWPGFRKVRRQVCKRIDRRCRELGLPDVAAYRVYLETQPQEWTILDTLCRISISRFYRDRGVFDSLRQVILPALAELALSRSDPELRCWCIGCASGEEVYTLNLVWHLELQARFPGLAGRIVATDADPQLLQRAQAGCYPTSSLKELPSGWRETAFVEIGEEYCLRDGFKTGVDFRRQDIRVEQPEESFHLILCRNSVLTYFEEPLQRQVLNRLVQPLLRGGALVIGKTEHLPSGEFGLSEWMPNQGIYRREQI